MSIGAGSYGDLYVKQYKDLIEQDLQQKGSLLRGVCDIEQVLGLETYFPKIGASTSYLVTGRSQQVIPQDQTNERRGVSPTAIEAVATIQKLDILRYARSPQPEIVESLAMELGRQIDVQIINALSGSAQRELNGVSSNITLAAFAGTKADGTSMGAGSQLILVNANNFASPANSATTSFMSGNTSLHEGKIAQAKQIMQQQFALRPGEELIIVGNATQFAGLASRIFASNSAAWFNRKNPNPDETMFDDQLDGFMNARFIQYELTGKDNTGSYDAVYAFTRRAIKLAIYSDLDFRVDELPVIQGTPLQIKAGISIGVVRMWDEAVVQIACNPTITYS